MSIGLHIVRKSGTTRATDSWYVYAWRGGPLIHKAAGKRPKVTMEILQRLTEAHAGAEAAAAVEASSVTVNDLVEHYTSDGTPEWRRLAVSTKKQYRLWLDEFTKKFGTAKLALFNDRRMRAELLKWRNRWQDSPRSADYAIEVVSSLLNWAVLYNKIEINACEGIPDLYKNNRAEVVWLEEDFAAFKAHASPYYQDALELARLTGIRRGDILKLPWSAVHEDMIIWVTSKSKQRIVVPLLPRAKELLRSIAARQRVDWKTSRAKARKPKPTTVLINSKGNQWTPDGFTSTFCRWKRKAGIKDKRFHDVRGTYITELALAGLSDGEIARIVGWSVDRVAMIRRMYVDEQAIQKDLARKIALRWGGPIESWFAGEDDEDVNDR